MILKKSNDSNFNDNIIGNKKRYIVDIHNHQGESVYISGDEFHKLKINNVIVTSVELANWHINNNIELGKNFSFYNINDIYSWTNLLIEEIKNSLKKNRKLDKVSIIYLESEEIVKRLPTDPVLKELYEIIISNCSIVEKVKEL